MKKSNGKTANVTRQFKEKYMVAGKFKVPQPPWWLSIVISVLAVIIAICRI